MGDETGDGGTLNLDVNTNVVGRTAIGRGLYDYPITWTPRLIQVSQIIASEPVNHVVEGRIGVVVAADSGGSLAGGKARGRDSAIPRVGLEHDDSLNRPCGKGRCHVLDNFQYPEVGVEVVAGDDGGTDGLDGGASKCRVVPEHDTEFHDDGDEQQKDRNGDGRFDQHRSGLFRR